ncbi:MAG: TonB-dependent receptor plug domain-containing protein [Verrucomicrobia bacterium]|nr:TonB-dependent receptor plug domain-containing protein [Verrucomicrobiota bacterium]
MTRPPFHRRVSRDRISARARASLRAVLGVGLLLPAAGAVEAALRSFDIPAGDAAVTLKAFAAQSTEQLLYSPDDVRGVQTQAVRGDLPPLTALEAMLHRTPLRARRDADARAIAITARPASRPADAAAPAATPPPSPPMKSPTPLNRLTAWLALLTAPAIVGTAQTAPATPPKENDGVEVLSPFTVNSSRDQGFVAASALAGGRLTTDLKDTPAAYSVLTRDFIEALNITLLTQAQQWTTGFNEIEDDGRQNQFGDGERIRRTYRGVQSNQQQIEFFPAYYDYDSYNLERFDFARGPNSILFGSGSMGGTANGLFKRAQTGRSFGEFSNAISSWNSFRNTMDLNWAINPKVAVRFNGLFDNSNTWRDVEYYNRRAVTVTGTYRPWKGANFRVTGEKGHNHRNASLSGMGDKISGWDGTTTFTGRITAAPTDANARGVGFFGVNNYIFSPGIMGGAIVDWNGHANTLGGNANAAVPVGGRFVVGPIANIDAAPLLGSLNVPSFIFQNVLRGAPKFYVPPRTKSTSLGGDSWATKYENLHVAFDQQFGQHVFLGVSGNYSFSKVLTHFTVARGLNNVFVDINRLLPDGTTNPNFLNPYSESTQDFDHVTRRSRNGRANAAFVFDHTRFGDFRLNLETGISDANTSRIKFRMMVQDPLLASRDWINQIARLRVYWNGPVDQITPGNYDIVNPVTGLRRNLRADYVIDVGRPNDTNSVDDLFTYQQAAVGAKLFKGKLNLLGAYRRDDYESVTSQIILRGDWPNDWNGTKVTFRPPAPADYFTLSYIPKNAAGQPTGPRTEALARPRTANVPQPQYAGDRFRDDYSLPVLKGTVDTYSTGGVFHLTKWASVYGNYAETWLPPAGELRINGERFVPSVSTGWDAGVRFSLLGDKISLSAGKYASKQDNIGRGTGTNGGLANALGNLFNSLANTNVLGDLSGAGINNRGMLTVPGNYFDTANRNSKGYEFELTANVTPQWRVSANYALQNAFEVDAYADTRAYIAKNDQLFKNILADAGVDVVAGQAVLRAGTTSLNSIDAAGAISSYNQINEIARNLTAAEQKVARLVEGTGNFFSDYTIREGRLKNVRLGLGLNYRGKEVIGYRGGDTIRTGPTTTADDPSVDATNPVYRKPYQLWTGVIGYTMKLEKLRLKFDFRVSNLLNENMLLYYTTAQRAPNGDITNPQRIATPSQFSFIIPRSYTFTTTVSF